MAMAVKLVRVMVEEICEQYWLYTSLRSASVFR